MKNSKQSFKEWWHSRPNNVTYAEAEAYSLKHEDDSYFSPSEIFWDRVRILSIPPILIGLAFGVGYLFSSSENKEQSKPTINSLEQKATDKPEFKEIELIPLKN